MENLTILNIEWEKIPFDFNIIKEKILESDFGLYQIYGHHPAYGHEVLLYIGKAQNQKFGERLNERFEFIESCSKPTSIRLGRLVKSHEEEILDWETCRWKDMISIAEKILIKAHAPAMNKQDNTGLFSYDLQELNNENFLIINHEDYGQLSPEVSTYRISYRFWNYDMPLSEGDN